MLKEHESSKRVGVSAMHTDPNQKREHSCKNVIVCDVTNCVYHEEDDSCSAREVKVGPQYASSTDDTVCNTFKP